MVVRHTPLVSIDLVVRNARDEVLLGRRSNAPARGWWFVPGGRVCKDERLAAAFRRITREELGVERALDEARLLGVYEHLYDDNAAGEPGFGTHYVVLAQELRLDVPAGTLPTEQHGGYRWSSPAERCAARDRHPNTKAYFGD